MVPRLLLLALLSGLCLGASCDGGRRAEGSSAAEGAPAAEAPSLPDDAVEALPGVDTSQLTDAEVELWVQLVNTRLSPCGDPISVGRCVVDKHKCGACVTAARYVTRLVLEGYDRQTIEEHYRGRFDKSTRVEPDITGSPVKGAPMAPITIVEYSDFQCPYCSAARPLLERLLREHEGKVKLVFKHFPLSMHPRAVHAARAAEAAKLQGRFWEMHDLLFEHQHELDDADLERYAEMTGLDVERFKADLASDATQARVDADRAEGEGFGVEGTPSIFVNGRRFQEPLKLLEAYVAEELEL